MDRFLPEDPGSGSAIKIGSRLQFQYRDPITGTEALIRAVRLPEEGVKTSNPAPFRNPNGLITHTKS